MLRRTLPEASLDLAEDIGMLYAIQTTPLYVWLHAAGRLNDDEAREKFGTNVIPLGMSREELREDLFE
jgi:Domain of unknown function (DUF4070)